MLKTLTDEFWCAFPPCHWDSNKGLYKVELNWKIKSLFQVLCTRLKLSKILKGKMSLSESVTFWLATPALSRTCPAAITHTRTHSQSQVFSYMSNVELQVGVDKGFKPVSLSGATYCVRVYCISLLLWCTLEHGTYCT